MEKVVVATGNYPLSTEDMREVNSYLSRGWSVKSVTVQNSKNHMTAIYVLENDDREEVAGTYVATALWDGCNDKVVLKKNMTYELTIGLHKEIGKWEQVGDNILITPDGKSSVEQRIICMCEDKTGFFIGGRFFGR